MFARHYVLRFAVWQEVVNIPAKCFGMRHSREGSTMSLLHYFTPTLDLPSSRSVLSLKPKALHKANKRLASLSRESDDAGPGSKHAKNIYSTDDHAHIGRYAAEHGPTKPSQHFTVHESTASLLKKQYLAKLHDRRQNSVEIPEVTSLPMKACDLLLLLGSTLDCQVKEYVVVL